MCNLCLNFVWGQGENLLCVKGESGVILTPSSLFPLNDKLQIPIGHGGESANTRWHSYFHRKKKKNTQPSTISDESLNRQRMQKKEKMT